MAKKRLSPMNADTFDKVCKLQRDHSRGDTYWIMTDGAEVTVTGELPGGKGLAMVSMPRRNFHAMLRWYMREQELSR